MLLRCIAAMLVVVLAWSAYTRHAWEDFFISFRASRNLALGHGLVYQAGERVHSFTSPLHTLVLAGLSAVTGAGEDPGAVLWLYRVIGALALGGAVYFVHALGRSRGWPRLALVVGVGLMACDPKSIDFTVSGMETPLLLFFLAWHCHALLTGTGWRALGLAWAGLMWTRPDAFIFIGASLLAMFVLGCTNGGERRMLVLRAVRAGLLGAALYGPWLVWAGAYYGSPIPQTIVAKGLGSHWPGAWQAFVRSPWQMLVHGGFLIRVYGATFVRFASDWGHVLYTGWRVMGLVVWLYWLNPWGGRPARMFSLSFFLATLYGANVPFAAWYAPPYALFATLGWGFLLADLWRLAERYAGEDGRARWPCLVATVGIGLMALQVTTAVGMVRLMRWQQAVDETGNRREIGRWLKSHASPTDRVFLECVGYIGYYSGLKTYDFPGLTSREVVAARRRLHTDDFGLLITELKPDWLVLRPRERDVVQRSQPGLLTSGGAGEPGYELVRVFDRSGEVAAIPHLWGRRYLEMDQCFEIYHRR